MQDVLTTQFTVYGNTGKSAVYPLLLDVPSDIIGQLNRRIVIPLLPIEKYPAGCRPDRFVPVVRLTDGKEYAVMTHELASIPVQALGEVFCDASQYRSQIKAAIDFLIDGF
ncbi:CcdB family protein [Pectobacterium sp. CHL-2024]|uniref:CcdB family protein n=1 Tax=Pectobacterium sp. CHL-2024 TaxID=3377079 RepID=UPI003822D192